MISVEKLKARLKRPRHPDWLHIGLDANDDSQLYVLSNDGIANINCERIELYAEEIKDCVREMISQGVLVLKENEKSVCIGNGRSVYSYSLKSNANVLEATHDNQNMYFSNTFVRWQRTHQVSDKHAEVKLGLSSDEFRQFREDELNISEDLMAKLAEITGSSVQFWINLRAKKSRDFKRNNENI